MKAIDIEPPTGRAPEWHFKTLRGEEFTLPVQEVREDATTPWPRSALTVASGKLVDLPVGEELAVSWLKDDLPGYQRRICFTATCKGSAQRFVGSADKPGGFEYEFEVLGVEVVKQKVLDD